VRGIIAWGLLYSSDHRLFYRSQINTITQTPGQSHLPFREAASSPFHASREHRSCGGEGLALDSAHREVVVLGAAAPCNTQPIMVTRNSEQPVMPLLTIYEPLNRDYHLASRDPKSECKFSYKPIIEKGRIRLIYLKPGKWEDEIHISYYRTSLKSKGIPYDALSYV
jgi:hypothetical protein